ncbi:MAG: hypothetical protein Q8S11_09100 [Daejeonella sp.]|uniref:hypothetical protein n=1 Tax=Daejeonella sp. TaxID=2805397 RepID=UPI0027332498|nr:hypothetical protein [Daejeonella sp.]MDP3468478.1 hypothetical protein [Daejeonella sp.]
MLDRLKEFQKLLVTKNAGRNLKIWLALTIVSILVYLIKPLFALNENQILYLFSSASQVIAAIFGLIITGYIFLRNELDRRADKDETLEEVVLLLKSEYFGSIIGISITTFVSIALCFLVIVAETTQLSTLLSLLINISVSTILTTLIIIISFVITILNPNSIEVASNKLRENTTQDKENESGSLEEFLKNFNQIDYILEKYGTTLLYTDVNDYESARRKRVAKTKLVYILYNEGKIDNDLKNNLIELISLRNSLVHGTDLFVSTRDVLLSEELLSRLKNTLGIR